MGRINFSYRLYYVRQTWYNTKMKHKGDNKTVPESFRPILWSYRFEDINPQKHKEIIIVQAINYGTLEHWRWICRNYSKREVRAVVQKIPATALRKHVRKLAALVFDIDERQFNYASRGAH